MTKKDYKKRIESLKNRRQDELTKAFSMSEAFNKTNYGETIKYVLESMEPIDDKYTKMSYASCMKIISVLKPNLYNLHNTNVDFDYQGSVPTNTHIVLNSDIDLLVVHQSFYSLEPPQIPPIPYHGNPVDDLKLLRTNTHSILKREFTTSNIDNTGSKAISINGGLIQRKVDLVISNYFHSVNYSNTNSKNDIGVNILDNESSKRILNFPFSHISRINAKDEAVMGNEKRLIRFLKTLKIDAKIENDIDIKISSYDIASLVYRMDNSKLLLNPKHRLLLLNNCREFFDKIISDKVFRDTLMVSNDTRKIFCDEGCKVEELVKLRDELNDVITDLLIESKPIFDKLEKAEVNYL